jgi:hypothetical protein
LVPKLPSKASTNLGAPHCSFRNRIEEERTLGALPRPQEQTLEDLFEHMAEELTATVDVSLLCAARDCEKALANFFNFPEHS